MMHGGGVQVETVCSMENGHKSSHKSKHKHKDKDRDGKHRSSHKDKHRDHDKSRHSGSSKSHGSSSSRDAHRHHTSSSRDKHRDKKSSHEHRSPSKNGQSHSHSEHGESARSAGQQQQQPAPVKVELVDVFDSRRVSDDFQVVASDPAPAPASQRVKKEPDEVGDNSDEERSRLVIEASAARHSDDSSQNDASEEDVPLSARKKTNIKQEVVNSSSCSQSSPVKERVKTERVDEESEEDVPLSARKSKSHKVKRRRSDGEFESKKSSAKKVKTETSVKRRSNGDVQASPSKKMKREEEDKDVWKWWEEEKSDPSVKWSSLEHKGPLLAPDYEPLPASIKFYYGGREMKLSPAAEEVATFYSKMLDHDYTTKEVFNKNFFEDWRKFMTDSERKTITSLSNCDFTKMADYFKMKTEERKAMSKEEKKALKLKNEEIVKQYGFCTLDGHKEKIGNFRVEPPGLFRGRGEHPKQGMVKRRLEAKDIIINCGKGSKIPEPPPGQRWKKVQHDNTVTWLACWKENIQGQIKYVMLNAASRLKGEKDWSKYETARRLHKCVDTIRNTYREDFKSKEMRVRQRAVAMYFIDKLALRAGNEKDEDQADTVGCCSLRVEHIKLCQQLNGKEHVVVFDFLGKDSIRYYNEVSVEKRVFKNLSLFMENKGPGDDLFDRLNTTILNKYLNEQMDGLSAKVFRTYNASNTLQLKLDEFTKDEMTVNEKILAYNRANRAVAILCNHQRAVPKTFEKSMENLMKKIEDKKEQLADAEKQYKSAKKAAKNSMKEKSEAEKKKKTLERIADQLKKLELSATDKEENKEIALGTSKLNYLDPRISVAWCKKWNVPIEKVYNKTQREKFRWAIDMAGPEFAF